MNGALALRVLGRNEVPISGVKYEILDSGDGSCFAEIQRLSDDASSVVVQILDGEDTITVRASKGSWTETRTFSRDKVTFDFRSNLEEGNMTEKKLMIWSFAVGIAFMLILLALSTANPDPTASQRQIWQAILSVILAAFANGILGLLEVNVDMPRVGLSIRAAGAFAIAVVVYFFVPAFA